MQILLFVDVHLFLQRSKVLRREGGTVGVFTVTAIPVEQILKMIASKNCYFTSLSNFKIGPKI